MGGFAYYQHVQKARALAEKNAAASAVTSGVAIREPAAAQ